MFKLIGIIIISVILYKAYFNRDNWEEEMINEINFELNKEVRESCVKH